MDVHQPPDASPNPFGLVGAWGVQAEDHMKAFWGGEGQAISGC